MTAMRIAPAPAPPGIHPDTAARRTIDVVVAGSGLVLLSPVLLGLGLWVRASSPGPALYRQDRVGRGEQSFQLWKFRTMTVDADARGPLVSGADDPRVTGAGRRLRALRLDELPQLVNLLRGDLTLVGPRPEVARYLPHYTATERELLTVRPGILGPGALLFAQQQSAELDHVTDPERHYVDHQLHPKLALDLAYLHHRSLLLDLGLLGRTAAAVVQFATTRRRRP